MLVMECYVYCTAEYTHTGLKFNITPYLCVGLISKMAPRSRFLANRVTAAPTIKQLIANSCFTWINIIITLPCFVNCP